MRNFIKYKYSSSKKADTVVFFNNLVNIVGNFPGKMPTRQSDFKCFFYTPLSPLFLEGRSYLEFSTLHLRATPVF